MRVQLRRLPTLVDRRRKIASGYRELLGDQPLLRLPGEPEDREHSWQSYIVRVDRSVARGALAAKLRERGVGCNIGTYASHLQPVYGQTNACPVSKEIFETSMAIPMHANLTDDQVDRVASTVRDALAELS
jgi:perosamine synthetase